MPPGEGAGERTTLLAAADERGTLSAWPSGMYKLAESGMLDRDHNEYRLKRKESTLLEGTIALPTGRSARPTKL